MARGQIILLDSPRSEERNYPWAKVDDLIAKGLIEKPCFVEKKLIAGENKATLSYLCFSSGTTGNPKACTQIPPHRLTLD